MISQDSNQDNKYELITLDDGTQAREYPDGAIRRPDGSFVRRPPYAAPVITTDNAASLAQRRHQLAREAAAAGIRGAADAADDYEAWSKIIEQRTRVALRDKGHAGNQAAELVGKAAGLLPDGRTRETLPAGVAGRLDVSDRGLAVLAELVREKRA